LHQRHKGYDKKVAGNMGLHSVMSYRYPWLSFCSCFNLWWM